MYILELAFKIYKKIKNGEFKFFKKSAEQEFEPKECDHIFVPIDSTKKVLACSKCGFMVRVKEKT